MSTSLEVKICWYCPGPDSVLNQSLSLEPGTSKPKNP